MAKIKLEDSSDKLIIPTPRIKHKDHIKKKLRPLVKKEPSLVINSKEEIKEESELLQKRWKWRHLLLFLAFVVAAISMSNLSISSCGFWATYQNNYNKIVHGDERHCYRPMESSLIIQKLREQIVGQDDAISLIGGSLNLVNRERIIQLVFVGSTGVGKTLAANIMMQNFRWQQNVINLIYDINFSASASENDFKQVSSFLTECGFNLIVIDDVPIDPLATERMAELERGLRRLAKQRLFKIVLVVILNGRPAEHLDNFVQVEFQSFTKETFLQCIEIHERFLNVKLKPKDIEELKFINFTDHGCKTLAKKLNLITNKV